MTKVSVLIYSSESPVEKTLFKNCSKCKQFTNQFSKNKSSADGLAHECKPCKSVLDKRYRESNKEKCIEKSKKYYLEHSDEIKTRVRQYEKDNKEKIREYRKKYFQDNKEKWNQYGKDRAKVDPVYRMKVSVRKLIIKALNGHSKSKSTEQIIGCSYRELKDHIEAQFEPWMSWENKGLYNGDFNYGWDIDHIVPLCTANSPEEVLSLNHYTNLRPLCSHINRNIKRDKHE